MNKKTVLITCITLIATILLVPAIKNIEKDNQISFLKLLPQGSPLQYPDEVFYDLTIPEGAKIIGVGEATHGTAEFMELKHRLFRYLVEHKRFRALVKEVNYMKSLLMNEYIWYGYGNIDSICSELGWIHSNKESMAVLHWMSDYNYGKPDNEKVYFLGIDSQLDMWEMDQHFDYIRKREYGLYLELDQLSEKLITLGKPDYLNMGEEEYYSIKNIVDSLILIADKYYSQNPHANKKHQILRLLKGLQYSHKFLYHIHRGDEAVNFREEHLFESAIHIRDIIGDSSGYMLWAHNAHVAMNPLFAEGKGSLGRYLEQEIGHMYYAIGSSFGRGSFVAVNLDSTGSDTPPGINIISSPPPVGSANYILAQIGVDSFLISLKQDVYDNPFKSVLDTILPFIDIGDLYLGVPDIHYTCEYDGCINVWQSFDALFFFNETTAITFE